MFSESYFFKAFVCFVALGTEPRASHMWVPYHWAPKAFNFKKGKDLSQFSHEGTQKKRA